LQNMIYAEAINHENKIRDFDKFLFFMKKYYI
jgi:hypothetical protein